MMLLCTFCFSWNEMAGRMGLVSGWSRVLGSSFDDRIAIGFRSNGSTDCPQYPRRKCDGSRSVISIIFSSQNYWRLKYSSKLVYSSLNSSHDKWLLFVAVFNQYIPNILQHIAHFIVVMFCFFCLFVFCSSHFTRLKVDIYRNCVNSKSLLLNYA